MRIRRITDGFQTDYRRISSGIRILIFFGFGTVTCRDLCKPFPIITYHPVNITEKARGHYNFLQHFVESGRAQLRGVIDKKFISCSFSRHAKTHASMVLVIWLNENVVHLQTDQYFRLIHAVMQVTRSVREAPKGRKLCYILRNNCYMKRDFHILNYFFSGGGMEL